jgi:protein gp37
MSKIEWCNRTWNPVVGCSKVSAGCKNCYAIRMAWRLQHIHHSKDKYAGTVEKTAGGQLNWTGKVNTIESELLKPLRWKNPTMIFVNSQSDLFHESIQFEFIDQVFAIMALCPQHTFQVLTKRPARMVEYFKSRDEDIREIRDAAEIIVCTDPHFFHVKQRLKGEARKQVGPLHITSTILPHLKEAGWYWDVIYTDFGNESILEYEGEWPLKNLWIGVSVENQQAANERIPLLLQVPAAVRFLSCEPLLGPIDLTAIPQTVSPGYFGDCLQPYHVPHCDKETSYPTINWVIVGGESGTGARPVHPDWVRSLRDQCQQAGVSYFFKQWGMYVDVNNVLPVPMGDFAKNLKTGEWVSVDNTGAIVDHVSGPNKAVLMAKVGKKDAGRLLEGREWNEFPGKQPVVRDDPDLYVGGFD